MRQYSSRKLAERCTGLEVRCADIGSRINTGRQLAQRVAHKILSNGIRLLNSITQHRKLIESAIETQNQNQNLNYSSLVSISKTESQLCSYLDSLELASENNFHIQRYKVLFDLFDWLDYLDLQIAIKLIYDANIHNDFALTECLEYIDKCHPNLHALSTKIDNKIYTMQEIHKEVQGSGFTIKIIAKCLRFSELNLGNQHGNYYESRFHIYEMIRFFENILAATIQPNKKTDCGLYMQFCRIAIKLLKEAWCKNKNYFESHDYDIPEEIIYFENQIAKAYYHNSAKQREGFGYKEPRIHALARAFLIRKNPSALLNFSGYLANKVSSEELMAKNYNSTKISPLRPKGSPSIYQGNNVLHLAARAKVGGKCILDALLYSNIRRSAILQAYFMKNEIGEIAAISFIDNINDRENSAVYIKQFFRLITQGLGDENDRVDTKLVLRMILQTDFLENNIHNIKRGDFTEIVNAFVGTRFSKQLRRLQRSIQEQVNSYSESALEQPATKKQRYAVSPQNAQESLRNENEDEEDFFWAYNSEVDDSDLSESPRDNHKSNEVAKPPPEAYTPRFDYYGGQRLFAEPDELFTDLTLIGSDSEEEPNFSSQGYSGIFGNCPQVKDFNDEPEGLEYFL